MAIPVQPLLIGVDVSKATLAICLGPDQPVQTLDNDRKIIARWLATLPAEPVCIAAEATNTFHLDLVDLAHHAGHAVYLVDGYRLSRYRDSIGTRAKTDSSDAQLLQRYLAHERDSLRPWSAPPWFKHGSPCSRASPICQGSSRPRQPCFASSNGSIC